MEQIIERINEKLEELENVKMTIPYEEQDTTPNSKNQHIRLRASISTLESLKKELEENS